MVTVVQKWVSKLSLMQQSVLLSAIRGPDGIAKFHKCKSLIRWYRRCVLISAFDGETLDNPYRPGGGSFTGPSCSLSACYPTWEDAMKNRLDDFLASRDELPFHYFTHFMHAAEVIGYKHPNTAIRLWWANVYQRMCCALHVQPETEEMMDYRLGDNEKNWREAGDESAACSD